MTYNEIIVNSYNKVVMQLAWNNYRLKKKHKGYSDYKFVESLSHAHKTVKIFRIKKHGE